MLKVLLIAAALLPLAGCNPMERPYDWDVKACRYELKKLAAYAEMDPSQRLTFINACMAKEGWHPTGHCTTVHAEGTTHCAYVKR